MNNNGACLAVTRHEVVLSEVVIPDLSRAISSHIDMQGAAEIARKTCERSAGSLSAKYGRCRATHNLHPGIDWLIVNEQKAKTIGRPSVMLKYKIGTK